LATFLIPITASVAYGVWLGISAVGLAHSTRAEEWVRGGALLIMTAVFLSIPRSWSRAIGIACVCALIVMLTGVVEFEVLRG
jgi:multidrug transporter EmrE-like cation transporter